MTKILFLQLNFPACHIVNVSGGGGQSCNQLVSLVPQNFFSSKDIPPKLPGFLTTSVKIPNFTKISCNLYVNH